MNLSEKLITLHESDDKKILALLGSKQKDRTKSNKIIKEIDNGFKTNNKEILKYVLNPFGYTVAHKLAVNGEMFKDSDTQLLTGENRSKENMMGHNGTIVGFIMAKNGYDKIKDFKVLSYNNGKGSTVAHIMASKGHNFKDAKVQKLKDDKGNTVAHMMAQKGNTITDEKILNLENNYGFSVKDFIATNN